MLIYFFLEDTGRSVLANTNKPINNWNLSMKVKGNPRIRTAQQAEKATSPDWSRREHQEYYLKKERKRKREGKRKEEKERERRRKETKGKGRGRKKESNCYITICV